MIPCRYLLAVACAVALQAQAPPTAPVVSARGVTNLFTQEPAPGTVALGGLVEITGLNLGPPEGVKAEATPWPTRLADVVVVIGGKPAPLYSVAPGRIVAQVPPDANVGLVNVVVRRASGTSAPAHVTVAALDPAIRTAKDAGYGAPWGSVNGQTIATTADGLGATDVPIPAGNVGPSDTPAVPKAALTAYVGGLRATVSATASTARPGEFDVNIAVPPGARLGDLVTFLANRQPANLTVFQPGAAPDVQFVRLPGSVPDIANLADAGVNGNFLLATAARGPDGCYAGITVNMGTKTIAPAGDCLTSAAAAILPAVAPNQSDAIGALLGPPQGDAQAGISTTVKIFSAAADPLTVTLPSTASALTAGPVALVATLPGKPAQLATIDVTTGDIQVTAAGPAAASAASGTPASPAVDIHGLNHVYAAAALGQNRTGVIAGDDPLKPTKAAFAVLDANGDVASSTDFPAGYLPLLSAVPPVRAGQTAQPAPPREAAFFDPVSRQFFALARAADSSKDAFLAFPLLGGGDPNVAVFPDGWFATSCTPDMRLFSLNLVSQVALAGSQVAETAFNSACAASGFLMLDPAGGSVTAIPIPGGGQLRVPTARTDTSLAQMNNYVFGPRQDTTRAGTSDTLYVLDGVNASAFVMPLPATVSGFVDSTVQQVPEMNSLLAQSINRLPGDQGLLWIDLDLASATDLPVPDGFTTVAALNDGASVCCLATRKLVGRALKQGGSAVVIYDLITGDIAVPQNPAGITSVGPPPSQNAAAAAASAQLVLANPRANTVAAVAYSGSKQAGIMVIRVP